MSKQQQDGATNEQLQTKPKTKISTLEERILEVEKQMAVLNGGTIAEKKSSEPELAAEEKMGEVQIAIEYNNPRKAVNFLSGKSSDDLESEEKAQLLKALRRQLDGLVLEQGKELRGEAQNNPVNKLPENEEKRNKGIITFATYEEAKEYADKMLKAYERLGIPCDLRYDAAEKSFVMKLPPQCRGKDILSMSPDELAALREEIAKGSVTVNQELGLGAASLLDQTPTNNDTQPENGFTVTLESLAKKLAELALRKGGMGAEGDTDADLKAQVAAIESLQDAVKSRMAEQLEKEQGKVGRKTEDSAQIEMMQESEVNAMEFARELKKEGISCSVVADGDVFKVKIDVPNEMVKESEHSDVVERARPSSASPLTSPGGAGLDKTRPALLTSKSASNLLG